MHANPFQFPYRTLGLMVVAATLFSGCHLTERVAIQSPVIITPSAKKCSCNSCCANKTHQQPTDGSCRSCIVETPFESELSNPQWSEQPSSSSAAHYPTMVHKGPALPSPATNPSGHEQITRSTPPIDPGLYPHGAVPQPIPLPAPPSAEQLRIIELLAQQAKESAELRRNVDLLHSDVVAGRQTAKEVITTLKLLNDEMTRVTDDVKNWKDEVERIERSTENQHRSDLLSLQAISQLIEQRQTSASTPAPSPAMPTDAALTPGGANE